MKARRRRYLEGLLIGAGAGAVFAVAQHARELSFDGFAFGVATGGAIVGGLFGLVVGACIRIKDSVTPAGESETPGPSDIPAVAATARGSYIVRHWRGTLSLPVSYWLNAILAGLAILAMAFAWSLIDVTVWARTYAGGFIALWFVLVAAQVWWGVGTWRSARRYAGWRPWGFLARLMIVIGFLGFMVTVIGQGMPQVIELAGILTQSGPKKYALRVLRDGTELEISGEYEFGLARDFVALLSDHPGVKTIHVNSKGGRLAEAERLAEEIVGRRMNTYVAERCVSACVNVFAAGENRWISSTARIGLHSADSPGVTDEDRAAMNREIEAFLVSRGVDRAFVEKGLGTPPEDIWFPPHDELFESGMVTAYVPAGSVGVSGLTPGELEAALDTPLYAALHERYPAQFAEIMRLYREGWQRGDTLEEIRSRTVPIIQGLYFAVLPTASDDALVSFYELLSMQIEILRDHPDGCVGYLNGKDVPLPAELEEKTLATEMEVGAALLRSAESYSGAAVPLATAAPILRRIAAAASEVGLSEGAFYDALEFRLDAAANCRAYAFLFAKTVKLPLRERSDLYRFLAQNAR